VTTTGEPASDDALAAALATAAGELLLRVRDEVGFADARALRDAGDARSQALLAAAFSRHRPADAVLSEEAKDDPVRLGADRVWIVDPLDGTREFAEQGRRDWAVHVALWSAGDLVAGAVALPALGMTLATGAPLPAPGPLPGRPRVVASRTRAPAVAAAVVDAIGGVMVPMGSAGAKAAAVIRGEAAAYVHAGGQYEWDSAAPVAVARAAGLHTSRLDGSPLRYNQPDPLLPDLVVCRPDLAAAILAVTARAS
jgi:3'(2'), 5'-bisphosphate nucleotidase